MEKWDNISLLKMEFASGYEGEAGWGVRQGGGKSLWSEQLQDLGEPANGLAPPGQTFKMTNKNGGESTKICIDFRGAS